MSTRRATQTSIVDARHVLIEKCYYTAGPSSAFMGRGPGRLRAGTKLEKVLAAGNFAVTVEVNPPPSASPHGLLEVANLVRDCADAYNVTDNIRAFVKMSSLAASILLLREGLEPVMQMVTRDRNRIGLQSDVLGASAHGVRNVLCLRGDDPRHGGERDAVVVEDITPEVQIGMYRRLRDQGVLLGGEKVQKAPRLFIGATCNPFGGSYAIGADILERRVEAGADFIQTQAVYDLEGFEEFLNIVRSRGLDERVSLLGGVVPLTSQKMARFLRKKVPGIYLPRELLERMEGASNPEEEGIRICLETLEALRGMKGLAGIHLMPVGSEKRVRDVLEGGGLLPRPSI